MKIYKAKIYRVAAGDVKPISPIPLNANPTMIDQLNKANTPDKLRGLDNIDEINRIKDEISAKINSLKTDYGLDINIDIETAVNQSLQNMNNHKNIQREPGAANIQNLEDPNTVNRIEVGLNAAMVDQAPSPPPMHP